MSESDAPTPRSPGDDHEVMASIDHAGGTDSLVIADISTDDAWLSVPGSQARSLSDCR